MRHLMKPLPAAMISGSGRITTSSRRSLRLDAGQTQQTRRIQILVTESPTADYARAEHEKSPGTSVIAAGPTREPPPDRVLQTGSCRTLKGRGMAPIEIVIASIASAGMTAVAQRGIHGHHPTI